MQTVLLTLVFTTSLLLATAYIWYITESILNSRPLRIGYVPSNPQATTPILKQVIVRYIPKTTSVRFIEAGCGLAQVSQVMAKTYTWKEVVAIDIRYTLMLLARLRNLFPKAPVTYLRRNLFDYHFGTGNCIYCYLSTQILGKLYAEGKLTGNLVVSLSFAIPGAKPTEAIQVPNWQKRMYVYDFRSKTLKV